jgi:hypothetical protein
MKTIIDCVETLKIFCVKKKLFQRTQNYFWKAFLSDDEEELEEYQNMDISLIRLGNTRLYLTVRPRQMLPSGEQTNENTYIVIRYDILLREEPNEKYLGFYQADYSLDGEELYDCTLKLKYTRCT